MKLVVITQSKTSENEISALTKMLEAGLDTLHVRKPHFSTKELEGFIKEIPAHFHKRLIIHSHHRLALKYNLKGFHFTDTHLKRKWKLWWNTKLIYIRKPQLLKTISFKRIDSIYKPEEVKTNYCFIGTMFHTISGELYSGFYKEQVEAANKKSEKNIIARGGVNERSIELAYELGFYGVALYGHLWKSDQPFQKYIDFVRYCKEKNIPIE